MTIYDIFDGCDDRRGTEFCQLIDHFISDIQHLESKVVFLRYLLSRFLPEYDGEMLRCDIFSDLAGSYTDQPAYQEYVAGHCDGHDPMDDEKYCELLMRLSCGEESVSL